MADEVRLTEAEQGSLVDVPFQPRQHHRSLAPTQPGAPECCCECSPPEFGGNLPDRECPLHGITQPGAPRTETANERTTDDV